MIHTITMNSPIGILRLDSDETHLKSLSFDAHIEEDAPWLPRVLIQTRKQLEEYFNGTRLEFEIPLGAEGTDFQRQVWRKLADVRYGFIKSYIEIARELGSENASRAVGMANSKNPIPVIIPCHRIIGRNGNLTGYAGGLDRKKWLLIHEQRNSLRGRLF